MILYIDTQLRYPTYVDRTEQIHNMGEKDDGSGPTYYDSGDSVEDKTDQKDIIIV